MCVCLNKTLILQTLKRSKDYILIFPILQVPESEDELAGREKVLSPKDEN